MFVVENEDSKMDSSSWQVIEKKARFILVRNHMLFLISFFSRILKQTPEDPTHFPTPPLPPTLQYDVILKCMRFPFQGFYDFIVSFICDV